MQKRLIGFDTLRFVAALLVVIGHCRVHLFTHLKAADSDLPLLSKGGMAVDFFFVLSGFLLTYLALYEYETTKKIDIKAFFQRRMLRILPLYLLTIFLGHLVLIGLEWLHKRAEFSDYTSGQALFWHLTMLSNYVTSFYKTELGFFSGLWSISVEEQFYLFFPFLMLFLVQKKYPLRNITLITFLYFLLYWSIINGFILSDISTATRHFIWTLKFHFMLLGSVTAIIYYLYHTHLAILTHRFFLYFAIIIYILSIILPFLKDIFCIVHAITFAFLLLIVALQQPIIKEPKITAYLGKISFGIYIFHAFVSDVVLVLCRIYPSISAIFVAFPLFYYCTVVFGSIAVAHFSYQYFEKYFLKKKHNFTNKV